MSIRPFHYGDDIATVLDITVNAFQYSDPAKQVWSVPFDLEDALAVQLRAMRRLYPVFWVAQFFASDVQSILRGFIFESDGEAIGAAMSARLFKAAAYEIGNVGVKPNFRRRGIAKQLVESCISDVHDWGATFVHLSVIEGNDPAIQLYEGLGFTPYSGTTELAGHLVNFATLNVAPALPTGYQFKKIPFADWQPRYKLAKRMTPSPIQHFCPIIPEQFQWMPILRWLAPFYFRWSKSRFFGIGIETPDGRLVAIADLTAQIGNGAANTLRLSVDPQHAVVTNMLLQRCMAVLQEHSPQQMTLLTVDRWQDWVTEAAVAAGFSIDYHQLRMGMRFS
jgi:GNAT superfamily N-acetyltransferase